MAIPFNTTLVTVQRVEQVGDVDGYDPSPPAPSTIVDNVRAVVSAPSGSVNLVAGVRQVYEARLTCDPCDLRSQDLVTDQTDGTTWTCLWARKIQALGMDHVIAQLRLVSGAAA